MLTIEKSKTEPLGLTSSTMFHQHLRQHSAGAVHTLDQHLDFRNYFQTLPLGQCGRNTLGSKDIGPTGAIQESNPERQKIARIIISPWRAPTGLRP